MDQSAPYQYSTPQGLQYNSYLSFAGITLLVWDICITFEQELRLIWPSRGGAVKWMFWVNRYIVPSIVVFGVQVASSADMLGITDAVGVRKYMCLLWCRSRPGCSSRSWIIIVCFSAVLSIGVSHALLLLKLCKLWDRKLGATLTICFAFLVAQSGELVLMAMAVNDMWSLLHSIAGKGLNICMMNHKSATLKGVWVMTTVFDMFAILMVYLNALSRPRRRHTVLMNILHRDGIMFFVIIGVLDCVCLLVIAKATACQIFLSLLFVWALSTTMVSRMLMSIREVELEMREIDDTSIVIELNHL